MANKPLNHSHFLIHQYWLFTVNYVFPAMPD